MAPENSKPAGKLISKRSESLLSAIADRQLMLQPTVWQHLKDTAWEKAIKDMQHHLAYLLAAMESEDTGIFRRYTAWTRRVLKDYGLSNDIMRVSLECMAGVFRKDLPRWAAAAVEPYVEEALEEIRHPVLNQISGPPTIRPE